MLCRQRPDLSDLSIRTQEGILVKNSKNISIKELIAEKAIYLVFIILLVAIVVVEPRFLSFNNFKNIFAQSSTKIIIALAAGMVLVVQGVDLSTGRMIGLAAVIFASLVQNPDYAYRMYPNLKELPLIVPLLLVLAICLVLGGISGVLVAVFKVPPFIATLGMQLILYGASSIYFDRPPYGAQPIGGIDSKVTQIAIGSIGIGDFQIPYLIIIAAAVCVVMWIVWNKTKFGKYMFAVGGNPEAAKVSGVDTIYKFGGAQGVAAIANGTETIEKVDKIVGPGNIFVATAKKLSYGVVDIDMVAGPSEVLVIADENANPKYIAADLMSQAEHDKLASAMLVTTSKELAEKVNVELKRQMAYLSRKEIIEESLQNYGGAILVKDLKEAFEVSNYLAPEHLEVLVENPVNTLPYIKNAGSIFLGEYSPEPLGDYMSGTNHVLPTGGTAKFYSALGVYDFVKYSSYSYYPKDVLETFKDDVQTFAKSEGLDAHANSIAVRFEDEEQ